MWGTALARAGSTPDSVAFQSGATPRPKHNYIQYKVSRRVLCAGHNSLSELLPRHTLAQPLPRHPLGGAPPRTRADSSPPSLPLQVPPPPPQERTDSSKLHSPRTPRATVLASDWTLVCIIPALDDVARSLGVRGPKGRRWAGTGGAYAALLSWRREAGGRGGWSCRPRGLGACGDRCEAERPERLEQEEVWSRSVAAAPDYPPELGAGPGPGEGRAGASPPCCLGSRLPRPRSASAPAPGSARSRRSSSR